MTMKDITLQSNSLCPQLIKKTNLDVSYRTYDVSIGQLRLTTYKRRLQVFLVKNCHYSNMQDTNMIKIGPGD